MASKEEVLKESGSFNKRFASVHAEVFRSGPFFDARDLVQVKYEMLRAAWADGGSVTDVAGEFGFSRKTYYQINSAFEEGGLNALAPKKTGPKGPSKLRGGVSEFIDAYMSGHERPNAKEVAAQLEAELGVRVHPRTIERYIEKKTDSSTKRRRTGAGAPLRGRV